MTTEYVIPSHFDNDDDVLEEYSDLHVRPFMQSTVVAAPYDNEFFEPSKGNSTYLVNKLSDDAVISEWAEVKLALSNGKISPKTILAVIQLAANIRSTEDSTNLLRWEPRETSVTVGSSDLSGNQLITTKMSHMIEKKIATSDDYDVPESDTEEDDGMTDDSNEIKVRAACYLSLCLMRLMKKDPSSFTKGIASIQRGFSQFYDTSSTEVLKFEVSKASVIAISDGLRSNARLGQTMIYCVATGMRGLNRTSQNYHLMRFSFCQHVELKGLHAYKLFYELDKVFNDRLPTPVFLSWLTNDQTLKAVMQICDIIRKYDNEKRTDEYLWLYARYLNNGYFYDLHTARCRWLVYVLGTLSMSQIPVVNESSGSPLDLMELRKMTKAEKITAKEYAEIFEDNYMKITATSSKMNRIQREFQRKRGLSVPKPAEKRKIVSDDMETEQSPPKKHATESEVARTEPGPSSGGETNIFSSYRRARSRSPTRRGTDRSADSSDDDTPPDV
ncbi:nucleocapsid protein [Strawberry virus 3]|nr:nucleocapsid protein [Strawberry virus 3]